MLQNRSKPLVMPYSLNQELQLYRETEVLFEQVSDLVE